MTFALPDPERHADFYAGVPAKRAVAWVIDTLATALVTAVIVPFTAFTALFFLPLLFLAVNFAWRAASLANWSATPGMRTCGIELRAADGRRLDAGTAVAHTFGTMLTWGFVLPQVASAAMMLITPRGQGLTDHVLGTVAIHRPART